jgi:hypothetical protein
MRIKGTRLLTFATHFPCIVLCLVRCCAPALHGRGAGVTRSRAAQMPLLLRRLKRLERQLNARLQARAARGAPAAGCA